MFQVFNELQNNLSEGGNTEYELHSVPDAPAVCVCVCAHVCLHSYLCGNQIEGQPCEDPPLKGWVVGLFLSSMNHLSKSRAPLSSA